MEISEKCEMCVLAMGMREMDRETTHFDLQDPLVSFDSNGWLLKLWKIGIVHIQKVNLASRESIKDESHLRDDWSSNVQLF